MADYLETDGFVRDFEKGEQKAFTEVFNAYFKWMYVFAFKLSGNEAEAEDIAIRAFSVLFQRHEYFSDLHNIRAFLYITIRNSCFDYLRYAQRLTKRQKEFQAMVEVDPDLENAQIEGEIMKSLYEAMEKLPRQCRQVLEMIYIEGLKYREVAEQLHISIKTVESQRRYALDKLRKMLSEKFLIAVSILQVTSLLRQH